MAPRTNAKPRSELNLDEAADKATKELDGLRKPLFSAIDKALLGVKSAFRSVAEMEKIVAEVALNTLRHAKEHGDVSPATRLLVGLKEIAKEHRQANLLIGEVNVYFRTFSPMRWNAKGEGRLAKPGEADYREFNVDKAAETPFYDMEEIKAARVAANKAHKARLAPAGLDYVINRAAGIIKTIDGIGKQDKSGQVRPFAKGQKGPIMDFKEKFAEFLKPWMAEEADVDEKKDAA